MKGDFGETTDWSEWSQEMQDYCEQDVVVTHKLWQHLQPGSGRSGRSGSSMSWLKFAIVSVALGGHLIYRKLVNFTHSWRWKSSLIEEELNDLFPAWIVEEEFVPKRNNKRLGYVEGEPFIKQREVKFNPNSTQAHRVLLEVQIQLEAQGVYTIR